VTALAPKAEAARPNERAALIEATFATIAYHRVRRAPGFGFRARGPAPRAGA